MPHPRRHVGSNRAGRLRMLATLAVAGMSLAIPAAVLATSAHQAGAKTDIRASGGAWVRHLRHLTHGRPGAIIKPQATSPTSAVTYPIKLPAGYQTPTGMAAYIAGNGLWLFAQGGDSAPLDTVFYWSSTTGQLTGYQLDAANPALQGGVQTPIAVDAHGVAWIGDNRTLVSVNRQTRTISTFQLPDVTIGAPGSGLPEPPPMASAQDFTDIDALAIAPDGSIVIARQFATELQIFDPSTHQATPLPLPSGTSLAGLGQDVAGQGAGDIAAVLYAGNGIHELGQYTNGQWDVSQGPCPAYAVSMTASTIAVTGPDCIAIGAVPGSTKPAGLAAQPSSGTAGSEDQPCAVPLTSGTVAMCAPGGITLASPGSSASAGVALGQIVSMLSSGPASPANGGLVALTITPGLMSAGSNGDLWFIPAQGGTAIGLLSPS
jgi:hypothetical protein